MELVGKNRARLLCFGSFCVSWWEMFVDGVRFFMMYMCVTSRQVGSASTSVKFGCCTLWDEKRCCPYGEG